MALLRPLLDELGEGGDRAEGEAALFDALDDHSEALLDEQDELDGVEGVEPEALALAEEGHARLIYAFWKRNQADPPAFENLFETLKGEILESGQPLEAALQRLSAATVDRGLNILELALDIEYRAYDLYRNIAEKTSDTEQRDTLLTIAQAEKKHMRLIGRALGEQG